VRSKLNATRTRCRLLGYLDSDDSEELWGYKLLRESDGSIVFSNDVVFDEEATPGPLRILTEEDDNLADPDYEPREDDMGTDGEGLEDLRRVHYHNSLVTSENIIGDIHQRTTRGGRGGGSHINVLDLGTESQKELGSLGLKGQGHGGMESLGLKNLVYKNDCHLTKPCRVNSSSC
jgi:hypothetical protein